jgi:hypothetical protein
MKAFIPSMLLGLGCTFPDFAIGAGETSDGNTSNRGGASATSSTTETSTNGSGASVGGSTSPGASSAGTGGGGGTTTSSTGDGGSPAVTSSSSGSSGGGASGGGGSGGSGPPPLLGVAASFAVLGGSTVTNVGPTSIIGDLGVSPGTSITGIPRGMPVGVDHGDDSVSDQAQFAATMAYNALMIAPCDFTQPTAELGGLTLEPGVYCFGAAAVQLTGALVLDADGDAEARFVFRVDAALTTAAFASVTLVGGADACNVYWLVGSSATVGEGSLFAGNILARSAITLTSGATVTGRAIARTAELAMDSNSVSAASCVD